MTPTIAFIGAGNMGSSLIAGLIAHGHPAEKIWASDHHAEKLLTLKKTFSIHTTTDNQQAVAMCDIVIFAVKPTAFATVATELATSIQKKHPLVISIAAGISIATIQSYLGEPCAIVRCMPNTPALMRQSATGLCANTLVTPATKQLAETILQAVGMTVWVENEKLMDTITALSGSGPAYFFLIMEILQKVAEKAGLAPDMARALITQTALGAATMAKNSPMTLEALRKQVTSPGGTTEKAISVLETQHIADIFSKAFAAAQQRAEELARGEFTS